MKTLAMILMTFAVACGGKKEQSAPAQGSADPVATGSGSGSAVADVGSGSGAGSAEEAPVDVPTEVDFEELASSEITEKNVAARVKEMEAELAE